MNLIIDEMDNGKFFIPVKNPFKSHNCESGPIENPVFGFDLEGIPKKCIFNNKSIINGQLPI
jgi:hypothetical protein